MTSSFTSTDALARALQLNTYMTGKLKEHHFANPHYYLDDDRLLRHFGEPSLIQPLYGLGGKFRPPKPTHRYDALVDGKNAYVLHFPVREKPYDRQLFVCIGNPFFDFLVGQNSFGVDALAELIDFQGDIGSSIPLVANAVPFVEYAPEICRSMVANGCELLWRYGFNEGHFHFTGRIYAPADALYDVHEWHAWKDGRADVHDNRFFVFLKRKE